MTKHLERDLQDLERKVLALSSIVEEMIEKACRALREQRPDMAAAVMRSDPEVDEREVRIEEECLKILALHQPVAIDLRRTAAVLKINNDLERIADLACNIAARTQSLDAFPEFISPPSLTEMAKLSMSMVHDSIDAFVKFDTVSAKEICVRDNLVDALLREVIVELYELMEREPSQVQPALHFFSAARHIERIADHATNIAEDVIYLVEGEIARHRGDEIAEIGESPQHSSETKRSD